MQEKVKMKYESLESLCCPVCKGELSYKGKIENGTIRERSLYCKGCSRDFPVTEGILRFAAPEELVGINRPIEKMYKRIARWYDSWLIKLGSQAFGGWEQMRRDYLDRLEIKDGSKILEVGIGTGANLPYIIGYAPGVKLYGLDFSFEMLRQCIKNINKWGIQIDLFQGLAEKLPFKDKFFDVVFHMGGINLFTGKREAIEEMARVAKPGTRIVIADERGGSYRQIKIFSRIGLESLDERLFRFLGGLFFGREFVETLLKFDEKEMLNFVPEEMLEVKFDYIWKGGGYRLEFRKP